jgi:membrane protease YdiL (CAAX protease family)
MNRLRQWLAGVSLPDPPPLWSFSSALVAVVVAIVTALVGLTVAIVWTGDQDYTQLAGLTVGGILTIFFVWQTRRRHSDALRLGSSPTPILFVMFVSFGCALALDLLGLAITREFLPTPELLRLNPNALGAAQWILIVLFMVVVQPIAEGLVFRGVLLPSVRALISGWGGVWITAAFSGAYHYLLYPPNYNSYYTITSTIAPLWYGLVVPIISAILFGAVRASSKSTRAAIAAQIAFGLFAVVKLLTLTGGA